MNHYDRPFLSHDWNGCPSDFLGLHKSVRQAVGDCNGIRHRRPDIHRPVCLPALCSAEAGALLRNTS
jgi:hypothetical protein